MRSSSPLHTQTLDILASLEELSDKHPPAGKLSGIVGKLLGSFPGDPLHKRASILVLGITAGT